MASLLEGAVQGLRSWALQPRSSAAWFLNPLPGSSAATSRTTAWRPGSTATRPACRCMASTRCEWLALRRGRRAGQNCRQGAFQPLVQRWLHRCQGGPLPCPHTASHTHMQVHGESGVPQAHHSRRGQLRVAQQVRPAGAPLSVCAGMRARSPPAFRCAHRWVPRPAPPPGCRCTGECMAQYAK